METDTAQDLRSWHVESLRVMGFTREQRAVLLERLEDGELELADLRDLIEKRGWTPEQAFLSVA